MERKRTGGMVGVRGNSEYAGLNSITCKHTEGGKVVKTVTETDRKTRPPLLVTKGCISWKGRCALGNLSLYRSLTRSTNEARTKMLKC
jgi:hypothetical protein